MTIVKKVISGGQWGADVAGLAAAHDLGIETGGTAPKGFRTIYGSNPKLQALGLVEHESWEYKPRTWDNVKNSDGTIRFAYNFDSPGEQCTLGGIMKFRKPHLDIDLYELELKNYLPFDFIEWVDEFNIQVVNVAGNAGKNRDESAKIFSLVRNALKIWLRLCNKE